MSMHSYSITNNHSFTEPNHVESDIEMSNYKNKSNQKFRTSSPHETIIGLLTFVSFVIGLIGSCVVIFLLASFSQGGLFSPAKLEFSELIIALTVGFYHVLLIGLIVGVITIIGNNKEKFYSVSKFLNIIGWTVIVIGALAGISILGDSMMIRILGGRVAFAIIVYNIGLASPCLGLAYFLSLDNLGTEPSTKPKYIQCNQCGKKYYEYDGSFCEVCGSKIPNAHLLSYSKKNETSSSQKKNNNSMDNNQKLSDRKKDLNNNSFLENNIPHDSLSQDLSNVINSKKIKDILNMDQEISDNTSFQTFSPTANPESKDKSNNKSDSFNPKKCTCGKNLVKKKTKKGKIVIVCPDYPKCKTLYYL